MGEQGLAPLRGSQQERTPINVAGVDLDPDWCVLRALYPVPGKWHLGTYECEDSFCGRGGHGSWYGFEECEPLSSIDPADLCLSCVGVVRRQRSSSPVPSEEQP